MYQVMEMYDSHFYLLQTTGGISRDGSKNLK